MLIKKPILAVVGTLVVLVGIVWAGQGAGLIGGSSMTSDPTWLVIGLVCVVVGGALVLASTRGSSNRDLNGPPGQH